MFKAVNKEPRPLTVVCQVTTPWQGMQTVYWEAHALDTWPSYLEGIYVQLRKFQSFQFSLLSPGTFQHQPILPPVHYSPMY